MDFRDVPEEVTKWRELQSVGVTQMEIGRGVVELDCLGGEESMREGLEMPC